MPEDTVPPTDMETPPQPRMMVLKVAVIIMGVLLVAGFGLVIATIVSRASNPQPEARVIGPGGQFGVTDVAIEKGDVLRTVNINEDRMAVHIAGVSGEDIIILNVKTGQQLGRFRFRPLTGLADAGQ
jgi:hypothetical protein